jgi:hypothetical protein
MGRLGCLLVILATIAANCSESQAAGSFQTKPAFVTAGVAITTPSVSLPSFSEHDLFEGCGRGRVRDRQSLSCRGPADIR